MSTTAAAPEPAPGELLELRIDRVAHGGHCVARHRGRVVFVRHTLPGERVTARITEVRRSYLRADAVEVLEASPDRVAPPCVYARPGGCGGCDFQHATPEAQRRLKREVVVEQLVRLGGVDPSEVVDLRVEPLPGGSLGWRTRVRYAVDDAGRAGLRRHRSHEVLPIDKCLVASRPLQEAGVTGRHWPPGSVVEVVSGDADAVTVHVEDRAGARRVEGPERIAVRAAGRTWQLAPGAFWQVHPAAADTLVDCVLDLLRPVPGEDVWDLYAGAGLFAAALAERVGPAGRVTAVESDVRADPVGNLADLPQVRVVRGRVERVLQRRGVSRAIRRADLVVLDPPRAGAGRDVVDRIAVAGPRAVGYVACDPAALARDVAQFRRRGWTLAAVRAFDAFPMTHHVECVALLSPPDGTGTG